jgi:hypothetical protein
MLLLTHFADTHRYRSTQRQCRQQPHVITRIGSPKSLGAFGLNGLPVSTLRCSQPSPRSCDTRKCRDRSVIFWVHLLVRLVSSFVRRNIRHSEENTQSDGWLLMRSCAAAGAGFDRPFH